MRLIRLEILKVLFEITKNDAPLMGDYGNGIFYTWENDTIHHWITCYSHVMLLKLSNGLVTHLATSSPCNIRPVCSSGALKHILVMDCLTILLNFCLTVSLHWVSSDEHWSRPHVGHQNMWAASPLEWDICGFASFIRICGITRFRNLAGIIVLECTALKKTWNRDLDKRSIRIK